MRRRVCLASEVMRTLTGFSGKRRTRIRKRCWMYPLSPWCMSILNTSTHRIHVSNEKHYSVVYRCCCEFRKSFNYRYLINHDYRYSPELLRKSPVISKNHRCVFFPSVNFDTV
uniref:Uncharacterized protein n=1 Tax=Cacopsylla melanoneura TaxID=428564 RepID=A0A8D8V3N9_9HEMI